MLKVIANLCPLYGSEKEPILASLERRRVVPENRWPIALPIARGRRGGRNTGRPAVVAAQHSGRSV